MSKTHGVEDRPRSAAEIPNDINRAATNAHIQWLSAKQRFEAWCAAALADGKLTAREVEEGEQLSNEERDAKAESDRMYELYCTSGRPPGHDPNP